MSAESVARNYAEALFALGESEGLTVRHGEVLDALAAAIALSPAVQTMLMSPKVAKAEKVRILSASLEGASEKFRLFLAAVVKRGRQGLLQEMAAAYRTLVDVKLHRTRASVVLAREADPVLRDAIVAALARATGNDVIATFGVDPSILGGTVVRMGEKVYDGSVKRRMLRLRRALLQR